MERKDQCMRLEWLHKIKEEVSKQLKAEFIKQVNQKDSIPNIIIIPKKYGLVTMCIYFRDFYKTYSKDDFLVFTTPHKCTF